MSYDVHFLERRPGQSWEEVLEQLEEAAATEAEDGPPYPPEFAAAWARVVARARELLGEITELDYEFDHEATGIQFIASPGECSLSVPYWHQGADAEQVMAKVFALADAVESETGLEAYDQQLDKSVREMTEADRGAAVELFASTSAQVSG